MGVLHNRSLAPWGKPPPSQSPRENNAVIISFGWKVILIDDMMTTRVGRLHSRLFSSAADKLPLSADAASQDPSAKMNKNKGKQHPSVLALGKSIFSVTALLALFTLWVQHYESTGKKSSSITSSPVNQNPDETMRLLGTRTTSKQILEWTSWTTAKSEETRMVKYMQDYANSRHRTVDSLLHSEGIGQLGQHEAILAKLVGSLIRESHSGLVDLIPSEGYFLDAGMQFGEFGAHMAANVPERKVMMLDPSPTNVKTAKEKYGALKNLEILTGGLGEKVGTMKARDDSFEEFPLYTLDSLFFEQGKKLAFAHLDGLEPDVLKGAIQTIRESKPIFTMEVRVHKDIADTDALMDFISDLGYNTIVINEVCGFHDMEYSNLLNIPISISVELMHSGTFNILDWLECR
jgi:hypothetical protein